MEMRKAFFAHRSLWWNPKRSTAGEIFWLMDQKGFPIRWHFERIPIINLTHVSACGLNIICACRVSCLVLVGTRQLRRTNKARVMQFSRQEWSVYMRMCICGRRTMRFYVMFHSSFCRANESHSVPLAAAVVIGSHQQNLFIYLLVCLFASCKIPTHQTVFRSVSKF